MAAVFLSHSSRDHDLARSVQGWLVEQGYGPVFVDFDRDDGLVAGLPWREQLRESMKRTRVFLALVSRHWAASRPCQEELGGAFYEGRPIVVLALDRCALDEHLRQLHFIDFPGPAPDAWKPHLARALEEAGAHPAVFRPDPGRPPFPGLAAFDVRDAALYFGRESEIADLLALLERQRRGARRLLVIAGPSGSGKSSLLRAGLLARLRRRTGDWTPFLPLRPGLGLDQGLIQPLETTLRQWYGGTVSRARLREALALDSTGPGRLMALLGQCPGAQPGAVPLLAVDQGEELFAAEAAAAVEPVTRALAGLLRQGSPMLAVVAIRSDRLGALQEHPCLAPLLADEFHALPPMPRERYGLLIDGPMAQYARHVLPGAAVEPALRDALVAGATGADALPLVAFTLGTLWEEHGAGGGRLTRAHLDALGGVDGAVARIAEQVMARAAASSGADELAALERAFVPGLAGVSPTGEVRRRRAPEGSLPGKAGRLLAGFVEARLLVRDRGPGGQAYLEIAHEALLRQWPRLAAWIARDRDSLGIMEELAPAATAWQAAERSEDRLVHRGTVLARAAEVTATELYVWRFTASRRGMIDAYLAACQALERREHRRRLVAGITLAAALVEKARREAGASRHLHAAALLGAALEANPHLDSPAAVRTVCSPEEIARARALAWEARSLLHEQMPELVFEFHHRVVVSAGSKPRLIFDPAGSTLSLLGRDRALALEPDTGVLRSWPVSVEGVVLDHAPGGHRALVLRPGVLTLADTTTGAVVATVGLGERSVEPALAQGRLLGRRAAILGPKGCLLVDFDHGTVAELLPTGDDEGDSLYYALEAGGKGALAVAGAREIHLWEPGQDTHARYDSGQRYAIHALAFDPAASRIVFGGVDRVVRMLDLATGELRSVGTHQDAVSGVAVLEHDRLVASTAWDGRATLWSIDGDGPRLELPTGGGMLRGVAATTDGGWLAVAGERELTLWRRTAVRTARALEHGNTVTGVAWDPARPGELVSAGFVGEFCAARWSEGRDGFVPRDLGLRAPLRGLAMAPRGDVFALCGDMGSVEVHAAGGGCLIRLDAGGEGARAVALSHDSRRIAWVTAAGEIRIARLPGGEIESFTALPGETFSTVGFSPAEDALVVVSATGRAYRVAGDGTPGLLLEDACAKATFGRGVPLAFSADGRRLALATGGSGIAVLDTADPATVLRLEGHTETFKRGWRESVGALAFDPRGGFLVSAGSRQSGGRDPRTIRLWDPATGEQLLRLFTDGDCLAAGVDPAGDTLCVGSGERLLLLPVHRWLLSGDTAAIKDRMERRLGFRAEDLL